MSSEFAYYKIHIASHAGGHAPDFVLFKATHDFSLDHLLSLVKLNLDSLDVPGCGCFPISQSMNYSEVGHQVYARLAKSGIPEYIPHMLRKGRTFKPNSPVPACPTCWTVAVLFNFSSTEYTYVSDIEVAVGQHVIVPVAPRNKLTCGRVVAVAPRTRARDNLKRVQAVCFEAVTTSKKVEFWFGTLGATEVLIASRPDQTPDSRISERPTADRLKILFDGAGIEGKAHLAGSAAKVLSLTSGQYGRAFKAQLYGFLLYVNRISTEINKSTIGAALKHYEIGRTSEVSNLEQSNYLNNTATPHSGSTPCADLLEQLLDAGTQSGPSRVLADLLTGFDSAKINKLQELTGYSAAELSVIRKLKSIENLTRRTWTKGQLEAELGLDGCVIALDQFVGQERGGTHLEFRPVYQQAYNRCVQIARSINQSNPKIKSTNDQKDQIMLNNNQNPMASFADKMFRKVDNLVMDMQSGSIGLTDGSGSVFTLVISEEDGASLTENPMGELFSMPIPAYAVMTPIEDVKVKDVIIDGNGNASFVIKKSEGAKTFTVLKNNGMQTTMNPVTNTMFGKGRQVMCVKNMLGDAKMDGMMKQMMPMMMMSQMSASGASPMEAMLPMMMMGGMGGGDSEGGMGNMMQMMMMAQMMGK